MSGHPSSRRICSTLVSQEVKTRGFDSQEALFPHHGRGGPGARRAVHATFPGVNGKIAVEAVNETAENDIYAVNPDGTDEVNLTHNGGNNRHDRVVSRRSSRLPQ